MMLTHLDLVGELHDFTLERLAFLRRVGIVFFSVLRIRLCRDLHTLGMNDAGLGDGDRVAVVFDKLTRILAFVCHTIPDLGVFLFRDQDHILGCGIAAGTRNRHRRLYGIRCLDDHLEGCGQRLCRGHAWRKLQIGTGDGKLLTLFYGRVICIKLCRIPGGRCGIFFEGFFGTFFTLHLFQDRHGLRKEDVLPVDPVRIDLIVRVLHSKSTFRRQDQRECNASVFLSLRRCFDLLRRAVRLLHGNNACYGLVEVPVFARCQRHRSNIAGILLNGIIRRLPPDILHSQGYRIRSCVRSTGYGNLSRRLVYERFVRFRSVQPEGCFVILGQILDQTIGDGDSIVFPFRHLSIDHPVVFHFFFLYGIDDFSDFLRQYDIPKYCQPLIRIFRIRVTSRKGHLCRFCLTGKCSQNDLRRPCMFCVCAVIPDDIDMNIFPVRYMAVGDHQGGFVRFCDFLVPFRNRLFFCRKQNVLSLQEGLLPFENAFPFVFGVQHQGHSGIHNHRLFRFFSRCIRILNRRIRICRITAGRCVIRTAFLIRGSRFCLLFQGIVQPYRHLFRTKTVHIVIILPDLFYRDVSDLRDVGVHDDKVFCSIRDFADLFFVSRDDTLHKRIVRIGTFYKAVNGEHPVRIFRNGLLCHHTGSIIQLQVNFLRTVSVRIFLIILPLDMSLHTGGLDIQCIDCRKDDVSRAFSRFRFLLLISLLTGRLRNGLHGDRFLVIRHIIFQQRVRNHVSAAVFLRQILQNDRPHGSGSIRLQSLIRRICTRPGLGNRYRHLIRRGQRDLLQLFSIREKCEVRGIRPQAYGILVSHPLLFDGDIHHTRFDLVQERLNTTVFFAALHRIGINLIFFGLSRHFRQGDRTGVDLSGIGCLRITSIQGIIDGRILFRRSKTDAGSPLIRSGSRSCVRCRCRIRCGNGYDNIDRDPSCRIHETFRIIFGSNGAFQISFHTESLFILIRRIIASFRRNRCIPVYFALFIFGRYFIKTDFCRFFNCIFDLAKFLPDLFSDRP